MPRAVWRPRGLYPVSNHSKIAEPKGSGSARCGCRAARAASWTRTTRSSSCRRWRRPGPWIPAGRRHAAGGRRPRTCTAIHGRSGPRCRARAATPGDHLEGVDDQVGAHAVDDGPAHDLAGEDIEHRAAVDLPVPGGALVRSEHHNRSDASATNPALHEVVVDRSSRSVAVLGPVTDSVQPHDPHQSCHPLAADPDAPA